ncbi:enoyl-CoA hydratase/isomerase family protein [Sporichthya brevicatena]|uniref:Enoyl-CoA hydratase/isomerase family protein n=1 Tax=Sporichthya brevicatena TaxID=171442 RepID=A0ABN1GNP8_9ACTN
MYAQFEPELLVEDRGNGIRLVVLNRPDAFNASNERLHDALIEVWSPLGADPEARAVVLTGAGHAFSAGGDMHHLAACRTDVHMRRKEIENARRLVLAMVDFPLPIVAAVNGPAVGLGCSLAALSDIVLIAEGTYMADPHVSAGLTAADGGAPAWPLLMSLLRAKEYLLTGDRIPAAEAVAIGLANRTVPGADLLPEALALAGRLAAQPAHAVRTTKKALNMHLSRAMTGVLEYALAEEFASFDTDDHERIVRRFLTKSGSAG